jgi:riboflavin kinase/FMN adenylyltransferase
MKVLQGFAGAWATQDAGSALAVGVFDGMHSGHRSVLAAVCRHAMAGGLLPGVVTFDPHPLAVVAPDRAPAMITDIDQRLELLEGLGMKLVAVVAFDEVTRAWSPSDFALGLLAGTLRARVVLAGEDFRFAKDRAGDVGVLRELGVIGGYGTEVVPLVGAGRSASSSAVRALIAAGEVGAAADELERPHEVRGVATVGDGVIAIAVPPGMAMPPAGAYAGNVGRSSIERMPALIRIGDGMSIEPLAAGAVRSGAIRIRFVARLPEGSGDVAAAVRSLVVPPGS